MSIDKLYSMLETSQQSPQLIRRLRQQNFEEESFHFSVINADLICTLPRCYLNLYSSVYLKAFQLRALNWHLVCEAEVTAARLQQQAHDVSVPVLAGAHQGRGALVVLQVHIGGAAKEQLHHGNTAVAHCEHERCLARLQKRE